MTLTSSALTVPQMNTVMQATICRCLGIALGDPLNDTAVRIGWQTGGAPGLGISENVTFLQAVEVPNEYDLVRDQDWGTAAAGLVPYAESYSRIWRVSLEFRGPLSFDNARLVRSTVLMDFVHDTLSQSNLYLQPDVEAPRRLPELFEGQWWERTNLELVLSEGVTETMSFSTVHSTEVILENSKGILADFTVTGP